MKVIRHRIVAGLFAVLGSVPLAAQPAQSSQAGTSAQAPSRPAGTAVLSGRVVRDNAPVVRATVTLDASDGLSKRHTITDEDGRFQFDRLPAGRFLVVASKLGWVPTHYGSPRPGRPPGAPVVVADGARVSVQIPMVPGSVIAGTIVDDKGRPMPRQFPWLLESRLVGDRRMIARVRFPIDVGFFERSTDDRGEFRLFGLPPGTYYIVVTPGITSARVTTADEVRWAAQPAAAGAAPPPGPIVGYAPVYFPGTTDPGAAQAITVGPGEVKEGLMFRVSPSPVARVAGLVQRPDGSPAARVTVTLTPRETRVDLEGSSRSVVSAPDGTFALQNVAPGAYRLSARGSTAPSPAPPAGGAPGAPPARVPGGSAPVFDLWGEREVTVAGQDLENLGIALAPAAAVSGRLIFSGTTAVPPQDLTQIRLQFVSTMALASAQASAGGGSAAAIVAPVQADGTFRAAGLAPDRYVAVASWPGMRSTDRATGWWLTRLQVAGRDLGDAPIEVGANTEVTDVAITFSDRIGAIEGQLTDAAGRPAPEYFVIAFSADRAAWTTTSRRAVPPVRPGTDGRFRVNGLLPGDYYLAVVTAITEEEGGDPAFLEAILPSAIKLTVAAGETRRQDLKIGR